MNNLVATKTVVEALTVVSKDRGQLNRAIRKNEETTYVPSKEIVAVAKKFATYKSPDLISITTALKIFLDDPANNYRWISKAQGEIEAL